ncbi:MAG: glutaredoxin family protein [Planctomycetota bacterium]|nr:glutaredoxin family protein [Planctomycetota bacterium]
MPNSYQVTVYTRSGCHLCDDAIHLIQQHGIEPRLVDIDADETLRGQFDSCVPVVEIDGKIRFRGKVQPLLLKRILRPVADPRTRTGLPE